ncbi:hypothetical protein Tco_0807194 [Tanacetum coccineum]
MKNPRLDFPLNEPCHQAQVATLDEVRSLGEKMRYFIRNYVDEEAIKNTDQAIEIASLKKRVDKLEKRRKFRTTGLKRLKKVGAARRIESSNDSLGAQEDASKQGRRIEDIDADAEVTLVNETQERQDEDLMFDTGVLDGDEMFVDATTGEKDEQSTKIDDSTAGEAVTTAGVEDSVAPTIQVSTADIGDEGVTAAKELSTTFKSKDKGRSNHDLELEVPLKGKIKLLLDVDVARNIQANKEKKIEGSEEKAKSSIMKSLGKKRAVEEQQQESPKRQKLGNDKETDEHEEVEANDLA